MVKSGTLHRISHFFLWFQFSETEWLGWQEVKVPGGPDPKERQMPSLERLTSPGINLRPCFPILYAAWKDAKDVIIYNYMQFFIYIFYIFIYAPFIFLFLLWFDWDLYPFLDLTALCILWFWVLQLIWSDIFLDCYLPFIFHIEKFLIFVYSKLLKFSFVVLPWKQ